MYYVYVIKSIKDNRLYTGYTDNLKRRFQQHNSRKVLSTRTRCPFKLLYYEACNVLEDAIRREKSFKTGFGRAYLKRRLSDL